jgi:hypothetical protein
MKREATNLAIRIQIKANRDESQKKQNDDPESFKTEFQSQFETSRGVRIRMLPVELCMGT